MKKVKLSEAAGKEGLFVDGDWIESKDQDPNGKVRLIQLADIGIGNFKNKSERYLTKKTADQLGCTYLKKGDLLLARLPDPLGRTCTFPGFNYECVTAVDICIIRVENPLFDKRWLKYVLNSPKMKDEIEKFATGTTRKRISRKNLENIEIPLPSLEEQKAIVAKLGRAQRLIDIDKAMLAKYDQLIQSVFLDMFGDMIYYSIDELLKSKIILVHKDGNYGGMYPRKNEFGGQGIPFLSAKHINDNGGFELFDVPLLNSEKANSLPFGWIENGDVLLSHNASVGKVALYTGQFEKALIGTSLTCFRTDKEKLNPYFLAFAFKGVHFQSQLKKNMGQTTRNQVPITAQRKLNIPVPEMELQNLFADKVKMIESQKDQLISSINKTEELYSSLVQGVFG